LQPDELPKVASCPTKALVDFVEKYHVSLDWLLGGDLKGLHRMMRGRKARTLLPTTKLPSDQPMFHADMTGEEFAAALARLPQAAQREIKSKLRQIIERREP
jgi:hypothetical protein